MFSHIQISIEKHMEFIMDFHYRIVSYIHLNILVLCYRYKRISLCHNSLNYTPISNKTLPQN